MVSRDDNRYALKSSFSIEGHFSDVSLSEAVAEEAISVQVSNVCLYYGFKYKGRIKMFGTHLTHL